MQHVAGTYAASDRAETGEPYWWLLLVTGSLWMLFALVVFRFDYTSVNALALLLGTVCLGAAALELFGSAAAHGWWRAARIGLATAFGVVGSVAFAHPGDTVEALAAVFAFYLLLRGVFDIAVALLGRGAELWWTGLVAGAAQVVLAFWAAGDFGHQAILLVVWVGGSALVHGLLQIVRAFCLRPASAA